MGNSLGSSTDFARRLESIVLDLPEPAERREIVDQASRKRELRQIGGISAGGSLTLRPGVFTFGSKATGSGRLSSGSPDLAAFTLTVDSAMNATIRVAATATVAGGEEVARTAELSVDGLPVVGVVSVSEQVIDAGSAQFVLAVPRPGSVRSRTVQAKSRTPNTTGRSKAWHTWESSPVPRALIGDDMGGNELEVDLINFGQAEEIADLVRARRKAHLLPDELVHRAVVGSTLLWDRQPDEPLFGTCAVGLTTSPIITEWPNPRPAGSDNAEFVASTESRFLGQGYGVPLSVDLRSGPVSVVGPDWLRSAVIRQILLSIAVTIGPDQVRLSQFPVCRGFNFCRTLPHFSSADAKISLAVVDREISAQIEFGRPDTENTRWFINGAESAENIPSHEGTLITVKALDELTIQVGDTAKILDGVAPLGLARSLAEEVAMAIAENGFDQSDFDHAEEQ